jgi:tetratricopeptide (TPR) repeat protein
LNRGDAEGALERYRALDHEAPAQSVGLTGTAQSLAMLGRRDEAAAALATLRERFAQRYVSPYQIALVFWRLGDADQALRCLDDAAASRDPNLIFAPTDPAFAGLRGQPRFDTLLQRHRRKTA